MVKFTQKITGLILSVMLLTTFSCANEDISLKEETLFNLNYGRLDDEIDLYLLDPDVYNNGIVFNNGLFYIYNGIANKVMKFNAYGDIIASIYNPAENPKPILLSNLATQSKTVNRRAVEYPFESLSNLAITSKGEFLVQDSVHVDRIEFDRYYNAALQHIVLRFDKDGEIKDFIGQEGLGGTPFPYIKKMYVNQYDEIIVVSQTADLLLVYWFSPDAEPIYLLELPLIGFPVIEDAISYTLENIAIANDKYSIYLQVNYQYDRDEDAIFDEPELKSIIHEYSLNNKDFVSSVEVPLFRNSSPSLEVEQETILYEMLGAAEGGNFFLLGTINEEQKQLMILNEEGRVFVRQNLNLSDYDIYMRLFHVHPDGILTALLAYEDHAEVMWWRGDSILGK